MTIADRNARDAHERENRWRNVNPPPPVGLRVNLLLGDIMGYYSAESVEYFRDHSGEWYRLNPDDRAHVTPMSWRAGMQQNGICGPIARPAYVVLSRSGGNQGCDRKYSMMGVLTK